MAEQAASEKQQKRFEVVIEVDGHTHAGEPVKKGGKVKVTAEEKAFMIEHKIIKG